MKQIVAGLAILVVVVAGISWATLRSSSAQEQDAPTETTVAEEENGELEDSDASLDSFLECLRDQGLQAPSFEESSGRFSFHLEFNTEDLEALEDAHEVCGDLLPFARDGFPFRGEFFDRDEFPFGGEGDFFFGDEFPFGGKFGGSFRFGLGEPLDIDELAECLAELGSFEDVDAVKAQLEQCLPTRPDFMTGIEELETWLQENGIGRDRFPFEDGFRFFEGPGRFGFDFDFDGDFEFDGGFEFFDNFDDFDDFDDFFDEFDDDAVDGAAA